MQHFDGARNIGDDNIGVQHDDGAPGVAVSRAPNVQIVTTSEAVENTVETEIAV